jgi:Tol biopolymer transport system component
MVRYATAVVCLLTVVAVARPAEAQYFGRNKVHYDRLDFRVLQTDHFDIYYYAEEEQATRHAARMAERWYTRFSRLLDHAFTQRQPIVLYASHPHFAQTNVTPSAPGEGTGGLTERTKSRIALPFAPGLGETDHVLGHEIAHAFQIDVARRAGHNAFAMPAWIIEGMAEYLSLGPVNTNTAMWMRDAAIHKRLPTLKQLDDPRYFPYRYGHAFWSYLAGRYGDEIVARMLRSKIRGITPRLENLTGIGQAELMRDWHASVASEPTPADATMPAPRGVVTSAADGARLHVSPAISPDGRRVMFLSERDRLSLDLFMADTASGAILGKIVSTATDPHFDSLQYIQSAGAWDPTGRRFAIGALSGGRPVLVLVDSSNPAHREEIQIDRVSEIYNPSWSPDGTRIVFSALAGGLSDLWIYTLPTRTLRQLTADEFADLQPVWSPDGHTIAFATDRFTTTLGDLNFGPLRLGFIDMATGIIRPLDSARSGSLASDEAEGKQVSPQWSPDGTGIYFVSDRDGVSNVYRVDIASGELRQVTEVPGGVSGITATSPSLAVASQAGTLAFSVYRNGRYEIETLDQSDVASARLVAPSSPLPPVESFVPDGSLARILMDARTGLPEKKDFASKAYDDRLRLESIAPPYVGAAMGNGFGGLVLASFGFSFSDTLRDRQVHTMFRGGSSLDDLAAQVSYTNHRGQWNWGVVAGVVPSRFVGARRAIDRAGGLVTRETAHLRYMHEWGGLIGQYHLNRSERFEFGAGVRRTGFEWQTVTRVFDSVRGKTVSQSLAQTEAGKPIYLAEGNAAFVHDTAVNGPTGPVVGQRLRLEVEPALGGLAFADVRVDARRYVMPVRPLTIAARVSHVGRYGPDAGDSRLTPLLYGLQSLVRGYDLRSFAMDECGMSATECSPLGELAGSRFALVNLEARAPLLGLLRGDLYYGPVPIEAIAFVDAGFLWTRHTGAPIERDRFRSAGAGARVNLGGMVFEIAAARPFDRVRAGWTTSLLIRPGF